MTSGQAILRMGGNTAVNVEALSLSVDAFKLYVEERLSRLGNMAFCDYFVSDTKSPKLPKKNTFYFYIQYYGYGQ